MNFQVWKVISMPPKKKIKEGDIQTIGPTTRTVPKHTRKMSPYKKKFVPRGPDKSERRTLNNMLKDVA